MGEEKMKKVNPEQVLKTATKARIKADTMLNEIKRNIKKTIN
jgi:hypothetical protein